ncbi:MAG: CvpA family protein [Treponemataceae bacterium]
MIFSFIDILFFIILLIFIVLSTIEGFVKSCLSKAAFVVSVFIAAAFTPNALVIVKKAIDIKYLSVGLAFIFVFIVAFLLLKIIQLLIEKIFSGRILGSLDHALGFFWGAIFGLAVIVVFLVILKIQPFVDCSQILNQSVFARYLLPIFSDFEIVKNGIKISPVQENF